MIRSHSLAQASLLALSLALAGCSVLENDKTDYKSAGKAPSLEVPPDLTQLARDTRYATGSGAVTASGFQVGQGRQAIPTAAVSLGDVRIERAGTQRWLVVKRPAEQLWGPVHDFWTEGGFLLTLDQQNLGIMETDWAENRAKIPQDFIRNAIGKVLDALYSTSERDKFRTRLERTPDGGTEIYISHRGMVEVYMDSKSKTETIWQPRAPDPELEAEFLRRLMVRLGVSAEQSKALVASGAVTSAVKVTTINNAPAVQLEEDFDRAWRRVGLALDRTGFTVEDRDRAQGTYFVRYVEPTDKKGEPGFFGKLLGGSLFGNSSTTVPPLKYRISLRTQGTATVVSVLNAAGTPEASGNAQRILQVIADDLR